MGVAEAWRDAFNKELSELLEFNVIDGNISYKEESELYRILKDSPWETIDYDMVQNQMIETVKSELANIRNREEYHAELKNSRGRF